MHASRIFSAVAALLSMVNLGPKATIGFVEVLSPGAAGLANTVASSLGVDLAFLQLGTGMASFPLELILFTLFLNDNSFSGKGRLHNRAYVL